MMNIKSIIKKVVDTVSRKPVDSTNDFLKSRLEKSVRTGGGVHFNGNTGTGITASQSTYTTITAAPHSAAIGQQLYTVGAGGHGGGSVYSINNAIGQGGWQHSSAGYTISGNSGNTSSTIAFYDLTNKEIVRLNKDGTVTWADNINIDEAAEAFGRAIQIGAERASGIRYGVKQRMRDAVFEELIDIANSKGTLTADDLTYMQQAAKIMDKLKGIKE
jgi:hypothetical protein